MYRARLAVVLPLLCLALQTFQETGAEVMTKSMPREAAAYFAAVNHHDAAAFADLFSSDAVIDDGGRTFRGRPEIEAWGRHDIFEPLVTLEILTVAERDGQTVVSAKADGNFDRTGLPDPVVIDHYFRLEGGKIVGLVCRLAGKPV